MPFCPGCKEEYRQGFSVCADCNQALVESLEDIPADKPKEEWVFVEHTLLCSIADDVNADILIAALKEDEIPVLAKKHGPGGYLTIYMEMNAFGVDIYVPQEELARAWEIYSGIMQGGNDPPDQPDEELRAELALATRNKRIKGWLIFAVWGGLALVAYLIGLAVRMIWFLF